jgi:hypothetical protein
MRVDADATLAFGKSSVQWMRHSIGQIAFDVENEAAPKPRLLLILT